MFLDPIVDSWLFMSSPVPVVTILLVYLYFVLKLGPKLMEKRDAFDLKKVMIGYNLYQVLFSTWLCCQALTVKNALPHLLNHTCRNPSPSKEFQFAVNHTTNPPKNINFGFQLANGAWWYFFSKIVELLDTVFFVLRKKQSQVTFLHVYHHSCTMFFSWGYLKFLPGNYISVIRYPSILRRCGA